MQPIAEALPIGRVADIEFVRRALAFLRDFEARVNAAREGRGEGNTAIVATAELAPGVVALFWLHLREYALLYDRKRWGADLVLKCMGMASEDETNQLGYIAMREEDAGPDFDRYLREYEVKRHIQPLPGSDADWHPVAVPIMEMPVARLMRMDIPEDVRVLILSVGTHKENDKRVISIQRHDGWKSPQPKDEATEHYLAMHGREDVAIYLAGVPLSAYDAALFTQQTQGLDEVEERMLIEQLVAEFGCHWFDEVTRVERPDIDGIAVLLEFNKSR